MNPAPKYGYYKLYKKLSEETNLLIAGCAGSGKSEVVNNIIYTIANLYDPGKGPNSAKLILCDPKRVELGEWASLPHCIKYEKDYDKILDALDYSIGLMEFRYREMEKRWLKKWDGSQVYIIIDELADLMVTNKKAFSAKMTKLMQLSRAAGVHVIACTQSPSKLTIPASAQINYTASLGLRCKTAVESRQAIGMSGCEMLPKYGIGYLSDGDGITKVEIPLTPESDVNNLKAYYRWRSI